MFVSLCFPHIIFLTLFSARCFPNLHVVFLTFHVVFPHTVFWTSSSLLPQVYQIYLQSYLSLLSRTFSLYIYFQSYCILLLTVLCVLGLLLFVLIAGIVGVVMYCVWNGKRRPTEEENDSTTSLSGEKEEIHTRIGGCSGFLH